MKVNLPQYCILKNNVIDVIAINRPKNKKQLLDVKGVGKKSPKNMEMKFSKSLTLKKSFYVSDKDYIYYQLNLLNTQKSNL